MTSPCEIQIYGDDKNRADRLAQMVLQETKRLERKYNFFHPDSYLSRINSRERVPLDPESRFLLQKARHYYEQTHHLFDVTTGTLKFLYRDEMTREKLEESRQKLLPYVGCERFRLTRSGVRFDNPYTRIDLGGMVKEYAVDRAVILLRKGGVRSALINYGGDIYALGRKPDGKPFRVGIKDPEARERILVQVSLEEGGLTTSGSYERQLRTREDMFSHILSKEREVSLNNSVTVFAPTCLESGIFSTALCIDPNLSLPGSVRALDLIALKNKE